MDKPLVNKWYPKPNRLWDCGPQDFTNVESSIECYDFFHENWGDKPAHFFARLYCRPEKLKKALDDNPSDISSRNKYGQTPLLAFAHGCWMAEWFDGRALETLDILLESGADVNARDNDGFTALAWFGELITHGVTHNAFGLKLDILEKLIESGAEKDLRPLRPLLYKAADPAEIESFFKKYGIQF